MARTDDPIGHGEYAPGGYDEVVAPPTDPVREAKQRDVQDPADVDVDPADLVNGGPVEGGGLRTTTGSSAGPGGPGRHRAGRDRAAQGEQTAPTTTGDATSGGFGTPVGGSTSDATTGAAEAGNFADADTQDADTTGGTGRAGR